MKTISVINQKGGVGKTACAYNMAHALAMAGRKTLLIDLDPSANATKGLDVSDSEIQERWAADSAYIFRETRAPADFAAGLWRKNDNLSLIPAQIKLALVHRTLQGRNYRESILKNSLDRMETKFDYCLIDCSPTLTDLTINAVYASDYFLVPVTYEDDALEGLTDLFRVIEEIKVPQHESTGKGYSFGIVRNQKDIRKKRTNDYIEDRLQALKDNGHILETVVRQDENINQAKMERKTIFEWAPHSNGALDFNLLTEELLNVTQTDQ